jgi:prepilin-type N-terminal cleavage/methylation domain-containing protein
MRQRGFSLPELLIAIAILLLGFAIALPRFKAFTVDANLVAAADRFKVEFRKARSMAIRSGVYTAIRFEEGPRGRPMFSVYRDGNYNGVRSADIRTGRDQRIVGPLRLDAGLGGVRVAIHPGTPEPPPGRGTLDPSDPIRFGRANMLSFSPIGTATAGTFYLAGDGGQAGVRVTPASSRVRVLLYRHGRWSIR